MTWRIDSEPSPRDTPLGWKQTKIERKFSYRLPIAERPITPDFFDILDRRVSKIGGPLSDLHLAMMLSNCFKIRNCGTGRFGLRWESRSAPSAGGLHPIEILCLPICKSDLAGIYDPQSHELFYPNETIDLACEQNAINVHELTNAKHGITLQLIADSSKLDACYENSSSLLLRDAGALATIMTMVATALDLNSVIIGRMGTEYCRIIGLPQAYIGVGAVHVSSIT